MMSNGELDALISLVSIRVHSWLRCIIQRLPCLPATVPASRSAATVV
jgi:hypothetical protein